MDRILHAVRSEALADDGSVASTLCGSAVVLSFFAYIFIVISEVK